MYIKKGITLLMLLAGIFLIGCLSNPTGNDLVEQPAATTSGQANLKINLSPDTAATLRAAATTANYVKVVVTIVNPGNSTTPFVRMIKTADIVSGAASVSFSSIPAQPVLVQILINNGTLNGSRNFHAAADLKAGDNSVTPSAVGSGDRTDLIANIVQVIVNSKELVQSSSTTLVATIDTNTTGLTDFTQALTKAIGALNPTGLITLAQGASSSILSGLNGTTPSWSKNASEIFAAGELWDANVANMQVSSILRQGVGGFGYVGWKHSTAVDYAITKISTTDGARQSYLKNPGALSHFIVLSDNSVVAAGFNSHKNTPVICKWAGSANANTFSTGVADAGLAWSNYFDGIASYGTPSNFSVQSMVSDMENTLYLTLKNSADNSTLDYRIDMKTGARVLVPGSLEDGVTKITASYKAMQTILENNSLSDSVRVSNFMAYIATDFKDIAGTPNRADLESTTLSRLQRYTINSYSFTQSTLTVVDSSTITVKTPMIVDVKLKPGAAGAITAAYIVVDPVPTITWKRYGTSWLIYQGLPYKSSEIGI